MTYLAKLTAAGAAKLAAATAGSPVQLSEMLIGDAGGAPYTPTGSETALVNVRASVAIENLSIDVGSIQTVDVTGLFPASVGGFTACEAGIICTDGTLFAIASVPSTVKPDPSTGAGVDLSLVLKMTFSGSPNITVSVDASSVYATQEWVRENRNYYALISATLGAPPGSPGVGATYLVPTGATGAWASKADKLAVWSGSQWDYVTPQVGTLASTGAIIYLYETTGWAALVASAAQAGVVALADNATAQAGADSGKAVTPASLAAVTATHARAGLVALATAAEAAAGADDTKAVTPADLLPLRGAQYLNGAANVVAGEYLVDTTAGGFTLTLPPNPTLGATLVFTDPAYAWGQHNWTLARNGKTIMGQSSDLIVNISDQRFYVWYNGSDWRLI